MRCIQPIVEGHGEDGAIRLLLDRIWRELLGCPDSLDIRKALRIPKGKLQKEGELARAVTLADLKIRQAKQPGRGLILILVDADDDLACVLGPSLQSIALRQTDQQVASVVAVKEYETWFVAAADSLQKYINSSAEDLSCVDPERARVGEKWIADRFRGRRYSKTTDQPKMTATMDLALARSRCPSLDKLCRELVLFAEDRQSNVASIPTR